MPESQSFWFERADRKALLILAGLCLLVFFANLGGRNFWDPDETRYAEVSREMLLDGTWLLPHINGEPYPDKPPLFFWTTALFNAPFNLNVTETPSRLVSAVSASCVVFLVFLIGKGLFTRRTGLFAGLVLLSSFRFFWQSHWLQIDMLLTLFETATVYLLLRAIAEKSTKHAVWAYLCISAALLTKGPVGLLPLAAMLVYFAIRRDSGSVKAMKVLWGLPLALILPVLWLVLADLYGGEPYSALGAFGQHVVERTSQGLHHLRPWHYFLKNFPADLLPWTFFFIASLFLVRKSDGETRSRLNFLVCWIAVPFVVFTLSREKRAVYLLPQLPVAALLIGHYFDRMWNGSKNYLAMFRLAALPSALLFGGAGTWLLIYGNGLMAEYLPAKIEAVSLLPLSLPLIGMGVFYLLALFLKKGVKAAFLASLIGSILLSLALHYMYYPQANHLKSPIPFSERVAEKVDRLEPLGLYKIYRATYHFYLHRKVEFLQGTDELDAFFEKNPGARCIVEQSRLAKLQQVIPLRVLFCEDISGRVMCLVEKMYFPAELTTKEASAEIETQPSEASQP